jgi:hypothetical protein
MRVLAVVAALTLAVTAPVAGAPALASSGPPLSAAGDVRRAEVARLPIPPRSAADLPASGQANPPTTPAQDPDPADGAPGPGSPALLPQVLAAVLGLVAAGLAFREVALRARRRATPGRPTPPGPGPGPDPDRASSRRP